MEPVSATLSSLPDVLRTTKQTFVDLDPEDEQSLEDDKRSSVVWLENALLAGEPVVVSDYGLSESADDDSDGSIYLFRF